MLTCGSIKVARSDAMVMSAVVTRSIPAPQAMPLTAQMIGLVICSHGGVASCGASHCRMELRMGSPWLSIPGAFSMSWSAALFTSAPTHSARPAPVMITVQMSWDRSMSA